MKTGADQAHRVFIPENVSTGAGRFAGRSWVVDQVADWMSKGNERFLIVVGEPGSGKSALAAWLVGPGRTPSDPGAADKLARVRTAWSASHFCVSRARGTVTPHAFAQSLAQQLSDRYDAYALAVLQRAAPQFNITQIVRESWADVIGVKVNNLIVNSKDAEDVYDQAVRQPLAALYAKQGDLGQLFVLVDGLDEAITFDPPNIVTLLAGSTDLPAGVRFLITSRNERRVEDQFAGFRLLDISDPKWAQQNDADVREYVALRMTEPGLQAKFATLPAGVSSNDLVDRIVGQAAGNFLYVEFLLDEIASGFRAPEDVSSLPGMLYGLYRAFLDRVIPDMVKYGNAETWINGYQPLLGSLTVAVPAAPERSLPKWLSWDVSVLNPRLDAVGQVTERVPDDGGARRLYHRSLADFLCADQYQGQAGLESNRYFVSPRSQHDRISSYYLDKAKRDWSGDWSLADAYGLRQLVPHLKALIDLTDDAQEKKQNAQKLYSLVRDERFRRAQMQVLGTSAATVASFRTAFDTAFALGDRTALSQCVQAAASSADVEIRALAAEAINKLHAVDPGHAMDQIKGLLA